VARSGTLSIAGIAPILTCGFEPAGIQFLEAAHLPRLALLDSVGLDRLLIYSRGCLISMFPDVADPRPHLPASWFPAPRRRILFQVFMSLFVAEPPQTGSVMNFDRLPRESAFFLQDMACACSFLLPISP